MPGPQLSSTESLALSGVGPGNINSVTGIQNRFDTTLYVHGKVSEIHSPKGWSTGQHRFYYTCWDVASVALV